ncbi:MAG: hypothetical protein LBS74_10355 [Oscillospiraceae bacterium]|nr:hypothetical protein [Oscillospiraceae bacterium]
MSNKEEIENQSSSALDAKERQEAIALFKALYKPSLYPLVQFLILTLVVGIAMLFIWQGEEARPASWIITGIFLVLFAASCWLLSRYQAALSKYKLELSAYIAELDSLTAEDLLKEPTPEEKQHVEKRYKRTQILLWVEIISVALSILIIGLKMLL